METLTITQYIKIGATKKARVLISALKNDELKSIKASLNKIFTSVKYGGSQSDQEVLAKKLVLILDEMRKRKMI